MNLWSNSTQHASTIVIMKVTYYTNAYVVLHFALYNVHWIGFEGNDIKLRFWVKNLIKLQNMYRFT